MRRTGRLAALGVLLAMTLAACAGERVEQAPPAAMNRSHWVQAIAENLPVIGPFMAVTDVRPESGKQDPGHVRYLIRAQFQRVNAVALVITLSPEGQVEGLELYPRGRW